MATRAELTIRESTSDGIQLQALAGTAGINLSSYGTVALVLRDNRGSVTSTNNITGTLTVNGAAGGSVLWSPGTADVLAAYSPYQAYLKVTVSATTHFFCPEDSELTITVREKFA